MLTIPTWLTIVRAGLIPPLLVCVLYDAPQWYLHGLVLLWISLLTDIMDGKLAARLNARTDFGALFDALTDKILIHTTLVAFLLRGVFPAWLVLAMFMRDMFTDGLRNYVAGRGVVMKAFIWGKLKFGLQFAGLNAAFLAPLLPDYNWLPLVGSMLVGMALAVSLPGTFVVIRACGAAITVKPGPKEAAVQGPGRTG